MGAEGQGGCALATATGFLAILSWALLPLRTVLSGGVRPFQLSALCFAIGAVLGFGAMLARGAARRAALAHPPAIWLLGVGGIFGYHFFYFTALRHAPYAGPLLATGLLIAAGIAPASRALLLAAALIAGGAGIAALASRRSPKEVRDAARRGRDPRKT